MNSIEKLFSQKEKNILSIYFTAGFPHLEDTGNILNSLKNNGADMIEIGMPYSDPLADGPVIQESSMKALQNGMTIKILFEQLKRYNHNHNHNDNSSSEINNKPLILMGYLNPVMQYGFEKFCKEAKKSGISGIILPDLPISEYEKEYRKIFQETDLSFIFLITPETSEERIRKIDTLSNSFIYAVSSSSITGNDTNIAAQQNYFERIKKMNLKSKLLIGFGIRDHATFTEACRYANGAIIGTAYIKAIADTKDIELATQKFLNSILNAS